MKKFAFLMVILGLFFIQSCSTDEDGKTTYTIKKDYNSGFTTHLDLIEYDNSGSSVCINQLDSVQRGEVHIFEANDHSEKVVVRITESFGMQKQTFYVANVFYLKPNANVDIVIDDKILTSSANPI